MDTVFVLLDDCHATAAAPTSRLYSAFVREHRCTNPLNLDAVWQAVAADQARGLHAAVFADYEWGAKLLQAGHRHLPKSDGSSLRVLMFQTLQHLSTEAVAEWLAARDGSDAPTPAGICDLQPNVDAARFNADIARIRSLISQGETYQVNYTFNKHGSHYGTPVGLYRRLRAMQPVAFGVLAALPQDHWVLSSSPELFVRNEKGHLTTRPMKGTASRLADSAQDAARAHWLAHDAKNRSENVMIVDLLRNDLGRISEIGSVHVPKLFAVETYRTVHQMTSTVESTLLPGLDFPAVLRALFPCGSITGAPKVHTMDLIAQLESEPRGLYCGAIGWVDAPQAGEAVGGFCLSVAIRTLLLGPEAQGLRPATLGVGGGIVLDSEAQDEFAETQAKARFLTRMDPGFTLFETLRVSRGQVRHLVQHLQRLQTSARTLGFQMDEATVRAALAQQVQALDASQTWRLRLDLQHDGGLRWQHAAVAPLPAGAARLVLSNNAVPPQEAPLLNHKTSLRTAYDAAIQKAMAHGAFDALFLNAQGEVTEGARSTLFAKLNGHWYTPPLASGVLSGVLRGRLLARCPGIVEKRLSLQDVQNAQELRIGSALRGLQRAAWLRDAQGKVVLV
ncbi:aminodeoxychorismate synthase component I [Rhodoferax lacus]|uniref:Aminodeoxychorismate synthase component I n=1 Tax=Rhodoferax lacus TaxID=2184758 RepID=A0A3E1RK47_9BURK|nr:aminodeoxychorismate synthase component I [Rhodoferax lacus]RFO98950.1 aminodeoxychorismate synthase component I [Rhodoferax lacus]